MTPSPAPSPVSGISRSAAWALLLCSSLTVLSGAIISPALPLMAEAFKDQPNAGFLSRLVITMPALAIALTGTFAGVAADRWGRRPLLLASLTLYAIAGTSGVYLADLHAILVGRFLLGVAVAGVMTAATAMIGDLLYGPERKRFLGRQAAFMAAGGVVFVPLGGLLSGHSYHAPFLVYGASLLLLPLAWFALPEPTRTRPGSPNITATESNKSSWPLPFTAILILATLLQVAFYLSPVQTPFLVQEVLGRTGLIAGVCVAIMTLSAALVSLNFERLTRGRSPWLIVAATALIMATGCVVIARSQSLGAMLAGQALFGAGAGLIMPNLMSWVAAISPEHRRGRLTGTLTAAIFAGQFLSPILAQPLVATRGVAAAFNGAAVGLGALAAVVGAIWLVALKRTTPAFRETTRPS